MITVSSLLMVRRRSQLLKGAREFLLHFQMPIAFIMLGSGHASSGCCCRQWGSQIGDDAVAVAFLHVMFN
jgi:hypothetical protein